MLEAVLKKSFVGPAARTHKVKREPLEVLGKLVTLAMVVMVAPAIAQEAGT
jgi:hypothetical protein